MDGPVGITGASGYLGSSLAHGLRARSFDVVEFRRSQAVQGGDVRVRPFDLGGPIEPELFNGISCLVHLAWDLRTTDPSRAWAVNVDGSKRLLQAALQGGVQRFVFVSSMSAYFGTRQGYGLMKLAVERAVLETGQVVVRPGLVHGPSAGGMTGTLRKLARLPVIPTFKGAHQFLVHVDDFVSAVVRLVQAEETPATAIGVAHPEPVSFERLMQGLAPAGKKVRFVAIPWQPVLAGLRLLERLGLDLPVRSESLRGLVQPAPVVPGQAFWSRIAKTDGTPTEHNFSRL